MLFRIESIHDGLVSQQKYFKNEKKKIPNLIEELHKSPIGRWNMRSMELQWFGLGWAAATAIGLHKNNKIDENV